MVFDFAENVQYNEINVTVHLQSRFPVEPGSIEKQQAIDV